MKNNWLPIYLKLEESRYFLDLLKAHTRFPKLVLFYTSSFLSSSRSVTFHIQKQISPKYEDGKKIYENTIKTSLSNEVSTFFKNLRNISEKQMFLPIHFSLYNKHVKSETWTMLAGSGSQNTTNEHLSWLEDLINTEPPSHSQVHIRWTLPDYPGGKKELINACEEYYDLLEIFVKEVHRKLEKEKAI